MYFQLSVCSYAKELFSQRNHSSHHVVTNHGNEMMEYRIERGAADAKSLKMYFLYLSSGATPHMTLVGEQPSIKSGGGRAGLW